MDTNKVSNLFSYQKYIDFNMFITETKEFSSNKDKWNACLHLGSSVKF